jgi:hypothetical protein
MAPPMLCHTETVTSMLQPERMDCRQAEHDAPRGAMETAEWQVPICSCTANELHMAPRALTWIAFSWRPVKTMR